jgi:hypothetical protein
MNKAQLKELVKNIMTEESEYQAFFKKALEKAGKSIPSMSDEEKKAFFDKIDSAWDGKGEKNEGNAFGAAVTAAKKAGEDEFEVGGETYKVEEALVGGQKKLDVDGDGDIEGDDLADLRAGKKADESFDGAPEPLKLKGIKINKKSPITFVLEISFLIGDEVVMSYLTTGTQQDAQKLKSKVEKAFNGGKIVSPSGIGYYAYNEAMELPKATIPSAVKSKLDMAIDKIKDSDLTYNQKVQVVGQVMDSLGIDKAEFNKMASKLKGTIESVNESNEKDILDKIEKLRVLSNAGKITGDEFLDKFMPLWKQLKGMKESVNEGSHGMATKLLQSIVSGDSSRAEGTKMSKELAQHYIDWIRTSPFGKKNGNLPLDMLVKASFNWGIERGLDSKLKGELSKLKSTIKESLSPEVAKHMGSIHKGFKKVEDDGVMVYDSPTNAKKAADFLNSKKIAASSDGKFVYLESVVKEGVSPKEMDAIKSAVQAASSFMGVGAELKKLGMKYTFATEPLPIYIIQPTPNNKVAIVNKKYATKPDFVHGDIAVGVMEGKAVKSVTEGRAFINAARKAKTEGLTEFEFNGKKYPVTIKD